MSITPVNSVVTVTTAGTRVQVVASTAVRPTSFYVEALGTNTGYIYVGLSTVSSTVYMARLSAGQGFSIQNDNPGTSVPKSAVDFQLSDIWIDSSVSGEKALLSYIDLG